MKTTDEARDGEGRCAARTERGLPCLARVAKTAALHRGGAASAPEEACEARLCPAHEAAARKGAVQLEADGPWWTFAGPAASRAPG